MEFKERIFQARKAKGMSQEDLAEAMGVSRQAVSKWETGDAMPDMEKLIALCRVLGLDMEYLALGKEAIPAPAAAKPRRWPAVLLAMLCLGVGILIGLLFPGGSKADSQPGSFKILESVDISKVNVVPLAGTRHFEIAILPSQLPEGMEVSILWEERISGTLPVTVPCTFDGNYYRVTLPNEGPFHYDITALLTLEGSQKQIPILDIDGDSQCLSYTHLWEEP